MKLEHSTYQKPLSLTGLGGGATSLSNAGAAGIPKEYWMATLGSSSGSQETKGNDIAVDSLGNVYVAGRTNTLSGGTTCAVIAKYSPTGTLEWQRYWGGTASSAYDDAVGITVDSSDNIYVVGHADSNIGGFSGKGALILKYNDSGTLQWQRTFGTYDSEAKSVDYDSSGNVYISGQGQYSNWQFVAKFNSSGTLQWHRGFSSPKPPNQQGDKSLGISVDRNNDVLYICGQLTTSGYQYDMTLAKYNLSGTIQWQRSLSGDFTNSQDFGKDVAVDSTGGVYVIGSASQLASSNPVHPSYGQGYNNTDGFIVLWNSSGYVVSKITIGGWASDDATGITIDSSNNLFAVGMTNSGDSISAVGKRALIMRLNTSLSSTWARQLGNISTGNTEEGTMKIAVDHQSVAIYTIGHTEDTGAGSKNMLITKLPTGGTGTGTYNSPHLPYATETNGGYSITGTYGTSIDYSPGFTDSDKSTGTQTPSGSDYAGSLTSATYVVS